MVYQSLLDKFASSTHASSFITNNFFGTGKFYYAYGITYSLSWPYPRFYVNQLTNQNLSMKNLIHQVLLVIMPLISFSQEVWDKSDCAKCPENIFVFDKTSISNLERQYTSSSVTDEQKRNYTGAVILENETDSLILGSYIALRDIPTTDKFILIGNSSDKMLIQNLKNKKLYVVYSKTFNYIDYSRTDEDGFRGLIKILPKQSSSSEKELLARYKAHIKKGDAYIISLKSIQKKYITKGYFDTNRVNITDKKLYNQKLAELKQIAQKLSDINMYEDKGNKAQDKLTTAELASLNAINEWNMHQNKLN